MSTQYVEQTAAAIDRIKGLALAPHAYRLLSDGEPVTPERLAAAAGWSLDDVEAALESEINAERDEQGSVVGFGLTLRPTAIRVTIGDRTLSTWCASDALGVPVILGRPVTVESDCAHTGEAIRIDLTPDSVEHVDPAATVLTAVRPAERIADLRADVCQRGRFFSSPDAATTWADANPNGHVYPIRYAFRLDQDVIKRLGWDAS